MSWCLQAASQCLELILNKVRDALWDHFATMSNAYSMGCPEFALARRLKLSKCLTIVSGTVSEGGMQNEAVK